MNKKSLLFASLLALLVLILNFQSVFAHETITVGNYEIVYGWINEPPIVGHQNGIEIFVYDMNPGGEQSPREGYIIHSLDVEIFYEDASKALPLEPVGEDETEGFAAAVLPTVPGVYTLRFSGWLGDTPVDAEGELQVVQATDAVQFPNVEATQNEGLPNINDWIAWLSLFLALLGIGLGAIALRRPR